MKVQITDEDLVQRNNQYFAEGEHEVVITEAKRGVTDAGKEYVEFTVAGHDDETGKARLWFSTEAGSKYALSILAGIASHNKQTDAEKEKVRDAFKAITDTDQVDDKFLAKFKDMDAFFTVYMSDRTYINSAGETKNSYDSNIYGYMPKPKVAKPTTVESLMGEEISTDDVPFA
jgi:hypothetical protein